MMVCVIYIVLYFFFFKQKTAYEMRISDWSSDVCSSDLRENEIDLVVIGPEQPLVEGLANALAQAGIKAFGPSAKAAQLEGSKGFTKDLCARAGIPTAAYARFDSAEAARAYLATQPVPVVIKADGLAAGKGVVIDRKSTRLNSSH